MTTKTTILLGAAAGAMMLLGAGGAWAQERCSGDKDGWVILETIPGGVQTRTCYQENDGQLTLREEGCDGNGNWVVKTSTSGALLILTNPGNNRHQCVTEEEGTCTLANNNTNSNRNTDQFLAELCP
jgi:hypothetical protein